tara:strand:+ start:10807 stop:11154 length:348 start_codon:yes stop_codon:yes gene_type:complete
MNISLKLNQIILGIFLILFVLSPILSLKILFGFIGNILLLAILIPLLLIGISWIFIEFYKSKIKICEKCGNSILFQSQKCSFCGYENANGNETQINSFFTKASDATVDIKAEEVD